MAPKNIVDLGSMGKKISMHCQGKKQKSTEKLGKVVKPQQRTSLSPFFANYLN